MFKPNRLTPTVQTDKMAAFQQLHTDIAHRGMGEFKGRGTQKTKTLPRDSPYDEVADILRDYANKPGVTAVTATQTTRVSDRRPGAWYFRVFKGVDYEQLLHGLEENERVGFENQRKIIVMRGLKESS